MTIHWQWLLLVPAVLIGLWAVLAYNRLVGLRNRYRQAYAGIDVQLQRRHDLIANLVQTAKGYLQHERGTLEAVTLARTQAQAARQQAAVVPGSFESMHTLGQAESGLLAGVGRLLVVTERYPELKADKHMAQLMEELTSSENRVAFARQAYNDAVMFYNTARETVPNNLLAGLLGFEPAALFEILEAGDRLVPEVTFS